LEQARINMQEEFAHFDFDKAVKESASVWEKELNKIQVLGDPKDQSIFYTALTKCLVNPRDLNENGRYFSPFDFKVHEGEMYTDLSLWDTFRSLHPLWVLIKPDATTDVINGMLNAYQEGGWIPKWPNPWYRSIMMGTHGDAVIADAYIKGIRGFDTEMAFEAMLKNANEPGDSKFSGRVGINEYNELGYVPADVHGESVARTLEFAYDDFCIGEMAKALGKQKEHQEFKERSNRYKNVLDQETGLIRGKSKDGKWLPTFDKGISVWARGSDHDTEIYYRNHTLLVPHDIDGLTDFMGGEKKLEAYLDDFFERDWYVFGSMGFYPDCPGSPYYQICSPVFDKIQMPVSDGKVFTIITNNNSKENIYIQSATLNGKPYQQSSLHHNSIIEGGTLVLEMGSSPNKSWGIE